jgi:hypothetical protein
VLVRSTAVQTADGRVNAYPTMLVAIDAHLVNIYVAIGS